MKRLLRQYFRLWPWFHRFNEYIFVLSHMRSGSSLLSHLLVSNPQVIGFGESSTVYRQERDLEMLKTKVFFMFRLWTCKTSARFMLDKILHTRLLDERFVELMPSLPVKVIILLREPRATLRSLTSPPFVGKIREYAVLHYVSRMEAIRANLESWQGDMQPACVTYDNLINNSEETLQFLTNYLGLTEPLCEHYDVLPTTGMGGFGDPADRIGLGRIIRTPREDTVVDIEPEAFSRCSIAYQQCLDVAKRVCVGVELAGAYGRDSAEPS